MFNESQIQKIKIFSTLTKINNECFRKCIHYDGIDAKYLNENKLSTELSDKEKSCLKNCSQAYLKMRDFIEAQLFQDFQSINDKNKNIFDNDT